MATNGILVINKPAGKTSRAVTNQVSRLLREKKAGHLGTLDPIATGVLPVVLGKATRLIRFMESDDKVYAGTVRLGAATDTQDAAGKVVSQADYAQLDPARITAAAATFLGEIIQVPPMFSAIKKNGTPLYKLARQGLEVFREPRKARVFALVVERIELPDVMIRVRCAPGMYMRTLADDLGRKLGCGAHLHGLVRLWSGPFSIEHAVRLEGLTPEAAASRVIPMARCLPHFPAVEVSSAQLAMLEGGVSIPAPAAGHVMAATRKYRLLYQGKLVAVADGLTHGDQVLLRPLRVFA